MSGSRAGRPHAVSGVLAALLLFQSLGWAQVPVPELKARVTDLTGTLSAEQSAALEEKLRAYEQRKGSQIVVLLVPTTEPEDIAEFGIRVADAWKPGRKGIDDGAILIVAKNDRRMRIEVGYGLEGVLTDAVSRRIIEEDIAPRFRANDFAGGIDAAVERMMRVVDGEPLPEPAPRWTGSPGIGDFLPLLFFIVLVPAFILRRIFGRVGGSLGTGALVGGVAWFLTKALGLAIVLGLIGFVGAMVLGALGGPRGWSSHRRGGTYGGWGGGFGGGRGGGFGGGGFGGGGGGFGGGGASGGW